LFVERDDALQMPIALQPADLRSERLSLHAMQSRIAEQHGLALDRAVACSSQRPAEWPEQPSQTV